MSIPLWLRPAPKGLDSVTEVAFTGQDKYEVGVGAGAGAEPHLGKFFIVLQRPPHAT